MTLLAIWLLVFVGIAGVLYGARRWKQRQDAWRGAVRQSEFPTQWIVIMEREVGLFRRMPEPLRQELYPHVQEFMHFKRFEGCGDLELTEEMRLIVATLACILVLRRPSPVYPELCSILLYPGAFIAPEREEPDMETIDEEDEMDGESWDIGAVVLAWDAVWREAPRRQSAKNVVLHEFAHQLARHEGLDEALEGDMPETEAAQDFHQELEKLRRRCERGITGIIDEYGTTDPGEFFAVLTEVFFGQPKKLWQRHRRLYDIMQGYYRVNPLEWG